MVRYISDRLALVLASALVFLALCCAICCCIKGKPESNYESVYKAPYVVIRKVFDNGMSVHGSGFFVSYKGKVFVMTAAHVVDCEDFNKRLGVKADNRFVLLDAKMKPIGEAAATFVDRDRDVAILYCDMGSYAHVSKFGFLHVSNANLKQLEDMVGSTCIYHGLCSVGPWSSEYVGVPFLTFTERVTLSRVYETKLKFSYDEDINQKKTVIVITVKGGGWFGCSGGPLLDKNGYVIGVASHLEESPINNTKTGCNYVSPLYSLKEFLGD